MAELSGRLSGACVDHATGALTSVRIDSPNGEVTVYKPNEWIDAQAFQEALGKNVLVRVVVTVEP